jgi:hypothetical protein
LDVRDAFNSLCNAVQLRTGLSELPLNLINLSTPLSTSYASNKRLEQEDYPDVRFWTRADWTESDDNEDINEELGRGMRFLEDKSGRVITSTRASLIRDQARSIWNQIGASNTDLLPTSWGQAGLDLRQLFNKQMRSEFPEFQYCEADWKAKAFATEYYPSWYRKYANGSKVKSEESGAPLDATSAKSRKRLSTIKLGPTRKKTKLSSSPGWSSSPPVDSSESSSDDFAQHTASRDLPDAHLHSSVSVSNIAKGKKRAEFQVPDPL